MKAFFPKRLEN